METNKDRGPSFYKDHSLSYIPVGGHDTGIDLKYNIPLNRASRLVRHI